MKLLPFAFLIALAAATVGTGGCANRPEAPTMEDPIVAREDAQRITADAIELDKRGDIDGAIAGYQRAIERYRDLPQPWYNIGVLYFERNMALEAASAFRTAAELMPKDPRPMKALGDVWAKQAYYDEASKYYLLALERDETDLPSLRQSILADHFRDKRGEGTAERIRRALMLESDPKWREFLLRQKQLTERTLNK
jgi:tetratricopeptide (TPR) repeat protein